MSSCCCSNGNSTAQFDLSIAYQVVFPLASYIALSFVLFFSSLLVLSRLVITVEVTTKSDLVLFNTSSQRKLQLLVSKHESSAGAMNNIHAAIALGLMIPPPNYVPPSSTTGANHHPPSKSNSLPVINGVVNHAANFNDEIGEKTGNRPKKSKW